MRASLPARLGQEKPHGTQAPELLIPLAHLNRVNGVVSSDLLDRFATTDRHHGDPGLELGAVGEALAHLWENLSGTIPRLKG